MVALRDEGVAAYVLAQVLSHPIFGRCAWVPHAGHAAADGESLRDVYAAAAEGWVQAGAERHYVLVPALDEALEPWRRLGFGHMHVEALRSVAVEAAAPPAGVTLRRGTRADLEIAEEIDLEIYRLQERSPSFARVPLDREARRSEWLSLDLAEDGLRYVVAEAGGTIIGHSLIFKPEPTLGVPMDAAYLASTAVQEGERGRGVGMALFREISRQALNAGYGTLFTNWRMTNLSASRFWTAVGFQPVYHRLQRTVGVG
jgi:GNAT superfamily N-acetyltransferase